MQLSDVLEQVVLDSEIVKISPDLLRVGIDTRPIGLWLERISVIVRRDITSTSEAFNFNI